MWGKKKKIRKKGNLTKAYDLLKGNLVETFQPSFLTSDETKHFEY